MDKKLFIGIHLPNKPKEYLTLNFIDFEQNVMYLKQLIANRTQFDAQNLELIYRGRILKEDKQLKMILHPEDHVHCLPRTTQFTEYVPNPNMTNKQSIQRAHAELRFIANPQISINSRVNIVQSLLNEYPHLRRDLGAIMMIRDAVLFNNIYKLEILEKLAQHYPILIEAASAIAAAVQKELAESKNPGYDPNNDSTNSSDEDSLSTSERRDNQGSMPSSSSGIANRARADRMQMRLISRQQLQAALDEIGFGSVNSLSNIAQRNMDEAAAAERSMSTASEAAPSGISTSVSDERISHTDLRNQLRRALEELNQRPASSTSTIATSTPIEEGAVGMPPDAMIGSSSTSSFGADSLSLPIQPDASMDQDQPPEQIMEDSDMTEDDSLLPARYRRHIFAEQLRTMAQMGFVNYDVNITFLNMVNGNVESAINLLMTALT